MSDKCPGCKSQVVKNQDICGACGGSGESDEPLDWHGCLNCNGTGIVEDYYCDCGYEEGY